MEAQIGVWNLAAVAVGHSGSPQTPLMLTLHLMEVVV